MANSGLSHKWKRFDSDLRRRLPEFPISIAETSLKYQDLEKIQKRALEIGIPPTYPNERFVWIMKVVNNLEKWASHIIPVNNAESVKDTIAYLKAAEQQFGLSFMRSVPLYKTIRTSNRKFFRIVEEYESEDRKNDPWIPKSVSTLEIHYLEKIVSPQDLKKIVKFNLACHDLVQGGYFTSDGVITATNLLGSLHKDDLLSHPLYPLLSSFNITIPPSDPCFVRVDSRLVSQLIIVILLMNREMSMTRKTFHMIRKTIQDKITDTSFRKSAEPIISELAIKVFPDSVTHLVQLMCNKYGHPVPKRKHSTAEPYRPFTSAGMTTRHRQRLREQSTKTRLFISPNRKISKLISEGTRLMKHDQFATIRIAIEDLKSLSNQLRNEEITMSVLLGRTDVSNWELEKLIPWNSSNTCFLYRIRSCLEDASKQLVDKITHFRFNRNIIFFRKFIHIANEQLCLIRGLMEIVQWSIDRSVVSLDDVERVLSKFHSPPPVALGIVRTVHDNLVGIRENLKILENPDFKPVSVIRQIVNTIDQSESQSVLPFSVNISDCTQIATASLMLEKFDFLKSKIVQQSASLSEFDSLNHSNLSSLWQSFHDLLVDQKLILDDHETWWQPCFVSHWFIRAKKLLNSNSVSDLIAIHQELAGHEFVSEITSTEFLTISSAVDSRIEQIQSVIDRLDNGDNIELCLSEVTNVSFSVIEQFRMIRQNYLTSIERVDKMVEVVEMASLDIIEVDDTPPVYRYSVASIRSTLNMILEFESRFPANKIENENVDRVKTILDQVENIGSITDRSELESIILKYGRRLTSPELEKAGEFLAQVMELEVVISDACKKDIGTKSSETVSQSFSKILESLMIKYELLKRANRLKISLLEPVQVRLAFASILSLSTLLRLWTTNKRDLEFTSCPRWTLLFITRAIAGFLGTHFKALIPKNFSSHIEWMSKQLNASNEILKEAKKSINDFAKTRFMIPMFHFSLYEPMEKIRKNFESKLGLEIKFCYKENSRQLDYICTVNTQTGKVIDRYFPSKIMNASIFAEPTNAEEISSLFEQRSSPKNLAELMSQLVAVIKGLREDVKVSKMIATATNSESKQTTTVNQSKGPLSFTKFLSLNFANIDLETSNEDQSAKNRSSESTLNDYWINNVDQIVGTGESSFFEKYLDLIEESKRARKEIDNPVISQPVVNSKPTNVPSFAPPPTAPIFSPPPSTNSKTEVSVIADKLVTWSGKIEGGSKQPNLNFEVSIVPVFRPLPQHDLLALQRALAQHPVWTLEGSMGIGKFCDYYQKLTSAANRRRREPYTFLLARKDTRFDNTFFDSIPMNTASAFAVIVQSQKMKLWILSVDGLVDYKPLPILPGVVFGMLEIPAAIFTPSAGYVENIYQPLEMNHLINQLNSELIKTGNFKSVYVSLASAPVDDQPPAPREDQWLGLPTGPVALAVPKPAGELNKTTPPLSLSATNESLARVFEMIGQEKEAPIRPQQPVYNPYVPPRQPSTTTYQASTSSWSRPNIVIGAPSTGPSVNELPNPRKGSCRFYNTAQGCQQGPSCKFTHLCSVCGDDSHNAIEHYSRLQK